MFSKGFVILAITLAVVWFVGHMLLHPFSSRADDASCNIIDILLVTTFLGMAVVTLFTDTRRSRRS